MALSDAEENTASYTRVYAEIVKAIDKAVKEENGTDEPATRLRLTTQVNMNDAPDFENFHGFNDVTSYINEIGWRVMRCEFGDVGTGGLTVHIEIAK